MASPNSLFNLTVLPPRSSSGYVSVLATFYLDPLPGCSDFLCSHYPPLYSSVPRHSSLPPPGPPVQLPNCVDPDFLRRKELELLHADARRGNLDTLSCFLTSEPFFNFLTSTPPGLSDSSKQRTSHSSITSASCFLASVLKSQLGDDCLDSIQGDVSDSADCSLSFLSSSSNYLLSALPPNCRRPARVRVSSLLSISHLSRFIRHHKRPGRVEPNDNYSFPGPFRQNGAYKLHVELSIPCYPEHLSSLQSFLSTAQPELSNSSSNSPAISSGATNFFRSVFAELLSRLASAQEQSPLSASPLFDSFHTQLSTFLRLLRNATSQEVFSFFRPLLDFREQQPENHYGLLLLPLGAQSPLLSLFRGMPQLGCLEADHENQEWQIILSKGHLYKWDSGHCQPWLVTSSASFDVESLHLFAPELLCSSELLCSLREASANREANEDLFEAEKSRPDVHLNTSHSEARMSSLTELSLTELLSLCEVDRRTPSDGVSINRRPPMLGCLEIIVAVVDISDDEVPEALTKSEHRLEIIPEDPESRLQLPSPISEPETVMLTVTPPSVDAPDKSDSGLASLERVAPLNRRHIDGNEQADGESAKTTVSATIAAAEVSVPEDLVEGCY